MSTPRSGPRYKLHYFKARGRAEVTRLVFKAAGVPFVDETFTMEEWPAIKSSWSQRERERGGGGGNTQLEREIESELERKAAGEKDMDRHTQ